MLFTSVPQFIVLAVLFVAGLLFGLGLHPGGKKWRKRFEDESANYAQFRRDADVRLREGNQRTADLERENAALQEREASARRALDDAEARLARIEQDHRAVTTSDTPIVAEPSPNAGLAVPVAATAAVPAFATPADIVEADYEPVAEPASTPGDLGRIRSIDPTLKTRLFGLGVTRFEDITGLSAEDEMALEQRLSLPAGYITREQWRDQAALLHAGKDAEQAERFPAR